MSVNGTLLANPRIQTDAHRRLRVRAVDAERWDLARRHEHFW